ncbi:uncharacterized protein LOC108023517 [Drosophila biarmipes]|uniref:uncharacterized protein LOC108023517 n=1 Tax=Drosophila biarmipes TaxID=125945 RepID=UPI0007E786B8|nr:uncharacterized protein LOC108023517 [Drosophila biarmipes]XP_050741162.1 uncharacterized protein LOC108023517 [Drosophila biarmipes]
MPVKTARRPSRQDNNRNNNDIDEGGAGDVNWMARVQQSPGHLPVRSSSSSAVGNRERYIRSRSMPSRRNPLRRTRRLNNVTVPTMNSFFYGLAQRTKSTLAANEGVMLLYLALILVPSIMELGPRIEFPAHWEQTGIFCFLKRRRLTLTFTGNALRVLIRSCIGAIVPLITMLSMESPENCKMLIPRSEGPDLEVPVNLNIYAINLLPYILRLKAGFYLFVNDTWVAYSDRIITIAETFNTWRTLVYLNQIMQLVYAFELLLLMIQGLFGLIQAYRIFKKFCGKDNYHVPQFEDFGLKNSSWFKPSRHTIVVYHAFRERAWAHLQVHAPHF